MRNRSSRIFRRRPNGRDFRRRSNNNENKGLITGSFTNARINNNFKPHQSVEKLLERYKLLAKEALSSGDRTLSENYLQHADHFERIISNRNLNQNNNLSNNSEIDQGHTTKSKE